MTINRTYSGLIFLLVLSVCSCGGRYELKQDKDGRTIRIDKWTGDISIIEGDKVIQPESAQDEQTKKKAQLALSNAKTWPLITLPQLGGATGSLKTSWQDGSLRYQFTVLPETSDIIRARSHVFSGASFTLLFFDTQNFKVEEIEIAVSKMSQTVDDGGKPILLEANDSVLCSEDTYRSISSWNLSWSGFD
ncbi:MAG: hypothetical protein ACRD4S_07975 [Candidatus Acidiferrales bacterium]